MHSRITIGFFICLLPLLATVSCQPKGRPDDLRKVDSLQQRLQMAEANFVIDLDAIRKRRDSMDQKYEYIERNYNDSVGWELQMLLTNYKGQLKKYGSFLTKIEMLEEENEELKERLENLKKDLLEGNVPEDDFDAYYEKEREIVNEHVRDVQQSVQVIFQIEKDYQRNNEKVTKLYEELKQKSPKPEEM